MKNDFIKTCKRYLSNLFVSINFSKTSNKMHLKRHEFLLVAITLVSNLDLDVVMGYSQGAPNRVCVSMNPGHGPEKQYTKAPFRVAVIGPEDNGKSVSLSITALKDSFTGFMIQARDANNKGKIVDGTFLESDKNSQIKSCNSDKAVETVSSLTYTVILSQIK